MDEVIAVTYVDICPEKSMELTTLRTNVHAILYAKFILGQSLHSYVNYQLFNLTHFEL